MSRRPAACLLVAALALCGLSNAWGQAQLRACTAGEVRGTQRYWSLDNNVLLDFGVSGSSYTVENNPANNPGGLAQETGATVSDASGQLLFTAGGTGAESYSIFRADGTVMPNGAGLTGQISAEQGAVAFGDPAQKDRYYVFTNDTATGGITLGSRTWYYTLVDMTLAGGAGAVVAATKNVVVPGTAGISSEAMTVVPNAAGDGYWVVGIEHLTNKVMAFEVTAAGISPIVESALGYTDASVYTSLAFNADGSKLVAQNRVYPTGPGNISVMDFDRSTGQTGAAITWTVTGLGDFYSLYSSAFSPDGNTLYVGTISSNGTSFLYTFDLSSGNAAAISASQRRIQRTGGYGGALRIGPDGALWWANGNMGNTTSNTLYRLLDPNTRPAAGATISVFQTVPVNGGPDYSDLGLSQTVSICWKATDLAIAVVAVPANTPLALALLSLLVAACGVGCARLHPRWRGQDRPAAPDRCAR